METLIVVWVVSLGFYQYGIIGTLSADNLLSPLVLLVFLPSALRVLGKDRAYRRALFIALLSFLLYALFHIAARVGDSRLLASEGYELAKAGLYFILPIVLISNQQRALLYARAIVLLACIVALSNFASSLGWYDPPSQRVAESRIGIEWLPRSVGLFPSYGDQAVLSAFAVLALLTRFGLKPLVSPVLRLGVLSAVILGIVSAQSRNVVLTLLLALGTFGFLSRFQRSGKRVVLKSWLFVFVLLCGASIVVFNNLEDIRLQLAGWGGAQAAGTVADRMAQYDTGLSLIKGNWISGVSNDVYSRYQVQIEGIHNLWLRELLRAGIPGPSLVFMIITMAFGLAISRGKNLLQRDDAIVVTCTIALTLGLTTQFYVAGSNVFWMFIGMLYGLTAYPRQNQEGYRYISGPGRGGPLVDKTWSPIIQKSLHVHTR